MNKAKCNKCNNCKGYSGSHSGECRNFYSLYELQKDNLEGLAKDQLEELLTRVILGEDSLEGSKDQLRKLKDQLELKKREIESLKEENEKRCVNYTYEYVRMEYVNVNEASFGV